MLGESYCFRTPKLRFGSTFLSFISFILFILYCESSITTAHWYPINDLYRWLKTPYLLHVKNSNIHKQKTFCSKNAILSNVPRLAFNNSSSIFSLFLRSCVYHCYEIEKQQVTYLTYDTILLILHDYHFDVKGKK